MIMERQSRRGREACSSCCRQIGYFSVAERFNAGLLQRTRRGFVFCFSSSSPNFHFHSFKSIIFSLFLLLLFICISSSVWMQCTKCPECRKTYNLCGGPRHEMMFSLVFLFFLAFVYCHKWSKTLDVQILRRSREASTSGVDIFLG